MLLNDVCMELKHLPSDPLSNRIDFLNVLLHRQIFVLYAK